MSPAANGMTLAELESALISNDIPVATRNRRETETVSVPLVDSQGERIGTQNFEFEVQRQRTADGFVVVYDTRTGEAIPVDLNRVPVVLRKIHQDRAYTDWVGKRRYTLDQSKVPEYQQGTFRCPLNPEHPDWSMYQALGALPCRKHNIPHLLAVQDHFRVKHHSTWRYLEQKKRQDLEAEEREFRRLQMAQMKREQERALSIGNDTVSVISGLNIVDPVSNVEVAPQDQMDSDSPDGIAGTCSICQEQMYSTSKAGLYSKIWKHKEKMHPGWGRS